ncbi:thiol reductant ABC exporter subunit CydC [Hydrogeniiclostridium mannosilyticum]|uniref:Thiol reductant ABC exporter subunit CydC n=2 Tax=Hydrogeniiclostridium mannosilyticum TaxID=2764322 RepID=A0A328UAR6_9FIRM|nr:thiol reductant ABC exporter subunit CydC [Hydrogeniiclostridium mannosilyticum]RAQ22139.1 thiol reductant ABC exporter subunit CydC [Hydrogeniiclostridium mannosilyticum]
MKKRSGFKVMSRLIGLVKPLAGYMFLAVFMGLIGHLCAAFITIFGGYAVLEALRFDTPFTLTAIFVCVVVFAVVRGVLRYAEQACNHFIAFKLLALIRDRIFRALRRLCPAKLEGRDKGDLISVITSDIELLEVFYAHTISPAAIAFLFTIILCLFIGSFHWLLGLIALAAYLVVGIIIPLATSRFSGDDGMRFRTKSGDLSSFVLDSLRGLSETLQYGQGKKRLAAMNEKTDALAADEERMKRTAGRNTAVTNTVVLAFDLIMLFVSALLCQSGAVGFEGVLIPTIALFSSFGPVIALAALGSTLQNTFAAGNRVLDILDETPAVEGVAGKPEIAFSGAVAEHVTFAYGNETILSDVSVQIPQHSVIGIVGRSGSGKSTLLKLLMRFWDVRQGKVKVSDTPINQINTRNLREMESFVTQETHLFHDSIANNLRIAKLDATDEEIEAACKKASVHDFIMTLPQGYDTPVGELGDTLSGGERQRLGLARAFLHDAPFLLLDEPTSNLDSLNEAVILKSLHEEREGKTVVLVSHRQSTMRIADTVYSVEHGRMS